MIAKTLRQLAAVAALGFVALAAVAPAVTRAQEAPATPAPAAAGAAHAKKDKSLLDTYNDGGVVMHFLLVTSVILVWLTVDGFIKTTSKRVYPAPSVQALRDLFRAGDYVGAYQFAKTHPSPFCDIVRAGIAYSPDGKTITEEAILSELDRVKAGFDARISYLSVIGVCTPMIGLTGTVIGMMGAFKALETEGAGNSGALAGHISEVLIATGSGLFIAIPAFICYYLLRNRVTKMMHDLQELAGSLFRGMPYDDLAGNALGDEETYAAKPAWTAAPEEAPVA